MKLLFALALCLFISGCAFPLGKKEGTAHHLIIGLGVVSINDNMPDAAVVSRANALGISLTDRPGMKFAAGYSSKKIVTIPTDTPNDMTIDIAPGLTGDILIKINNLNLSKNKNAQE